MAKEYIEVDMECIYCKTKFTGKEWTEREGILKGCRIIESPCCSPRCEKAIKRIFENNGHYHLQ